jgi:hypothetical protein
MPLFIEKLMMGSPAAKVDLTPLLTPTCTHNAFQRDTLHTLSAALPVYGAGAASNHSKKLWDYLRLEVSTTEVGMWSLCPHCLSVDLPTIR